MGNNVQNDFDDVKRNVHYEMQSEDCFFLIEFEMKINLYLELELKNFILSMQSGWVEKKKKKNNKSVMLEAYCELISRGLHLTLSKLDSLLYIATPLNQLRLKKIFKLPCLIALLVLHLDTA